MSVSTAEIKLLREQTGAGILDCRKALEENGGDMEKAIAFLREKGLADAEKRSGRETGNGRLELYDHGDGRVGVMVEVNCETDFVARTDEFKELAHNLVMQVAALSPQFITREEIPEGADIEPQAACLLLQPYIRDPSMTVRDVIVETIAKVGENIKVSRFARFELGN